MTSLMRLRNLDAVAWRTATWALPFTVQLVLAAVVIAYWLLGKDPFGLHEIPALLAGVGVTMILSAVAAAPLLVSRSPRLHALALSVIGSNLVVLVGGVFFGFWYFQW